jgi:hypothetical protein
MINRATVKLFTVYSNSKYLFTLLYDERFNKISISSNTGLYGLNKEIYDYIIELHNKILSKDINYGQPYNDDIVNQPIKNLLLEDFIKCLIKEERNNKVDFLIK